MNTVSVVRPRIVECAIELFGDKGFDGVTVAELALAAKTTNASVYRLFGRQKSKVYSVAVREAVHRAHEAVEECKFLLEDATVDLAGRIGMVLQYWYRIFGGKEARLLQQVLKSDSKNRKLARAPLEKMIDRLATALEQVGARGKSPEVLRALAKTQIDALFQTKVSGGDDTEAGVKSSVNAFVDVLFK